MHNGIIENADELRAKLEADGAVFVSETDTEVLAHLIARTVEDDRHAGGGRPDGAQARSSARTASR